MAGTTLVDRALLRLSGEDVRGFLQGLVTNDMAQLAPERPLWAGLLTAQGKALFDFILWADGEDVLIDCEADAGGGAGAAADALPAAPRDRDRARRRAGVHWSPRAASRAAPDPRLPALGRRWLAPRRTSAGATGWLRAPAARSA